MHTFLKQSTVFFLVVALVLIPMAVSAENITFDDSDAYGMTADLFLARPFGLASIVLGTAIFVISLPFSATGSNVGEAGQALVAEPVKFTLARPLGDF